MYNPGMELSDVLKGSELFRGMSAKALARLAAMGRQKSFGPGATLFLEVTRGSEFYLLMEGEVPCTRPRRTARRW
jgi:CRP-like cAMP-binding protein